jgi:hypothetical protein
MTTATNIDIIPGGGPFTINYGESFIICNGTDDPSPTIVNGINVINVIDYLKHNLDSLIKIKAIAYNKITREKAYIKPDNFIPVLLKASGHMICTTELDFKDFVRSINCTYNGLADFIIRFSISKSIYHSGQELLEIIKEVGYYYKYGFQYYNPIFTGTAITTTITSTASINSYRIIDPINPLIISGIHLSSNYGLTTI